MSRALDSAQRRLERADKLVKAGKAGFALYVVIVITVLMGQLYVIQADQRAILDKLLISNAEQHQLTQGYVKCLAKALLLPLSQRNEEAFDKCGIDAEALPDGSTATSDTPPTKSTPTTSSQAPTVSAPQTQQTSPTPTTGGPPDPERPTEPFEGDLLYNILDTLISPIRAL